ncbi:class I SAM-dependent methyltransferase [Herbaspirillum autotrophicum]|uniref:class I SAM-dependent methyltransferase n=1 Tax=Herbaspirillum autotrophicum TaxID=180195 RepID=UPI0009FB76DA|nr:class I SAM-dependent methyltransferase [Herbaspirillum autotrophicum]
MQTVTRKKTGALQIQDKARAHDDVYDAIERSILFQQILAQAMGNDYPPDSTQYSFVGMQGLRWLAKRIESAPDGTCIDLGCGDGSLSVWLHRLCGRKITGCDISEKAISIAKKKAHIDCDFVVSDFCQLPFDNGSVTAISALDCIQHAQSPLLLANELARISVPGTRFLFTHWMRLLAPKILAQYDPLCLALHTAKFRIKEVFNLDPSLNMQFRVYAYVHANQGLLEEKLGSTLFHSLISEARHLHPVRNDVGHLAVSAIWNPDLD